ncbi:leucyl aminopeptidase [Serpentinicella alkaliphila]|uniref:Probable cytosol aminopeptidase n=1 Tax=Serpentinicella alkaliphila TaxID=1734049 RepID=A0A4R2TFN6_9FIRM|nr:leucyl aminopeptidase [Serpentinicella alkaliphila]QUH25324.1 leucyl aminopeptidase [Serpentinicella alkaliphila]TCQ02390.1 leucyl aminopeptidase [Serpentinicella alkaliphila]
MIIKSQKDNSRNIVVDALVLGIYEDVKSVREDLQILDEKIGNAIQSLIRDEEFKGKNSELTVIHTLGKIPAKKIILVGLGKTKDFNDDTVRKVAATAIRAANKSKCKTVAFDLLNGITNLEIKKSSQCICEGSLLGLYSFNKYKTNNENKQAYVNEIYILTNEDNNKIEEGILVGEALAKGTILARDLVNEPANHLTPTEMANIANKVAKDNGFEIEILEREDLDRLGMGCFVAVTQGTEQPPKLVVLKYNGGKKDDEVLALVGKGLTFDSGGISIKPSAGMEEMKGDMAGAAAVLGAMHTIGKLKPKINVIAVLGLCENMPSGRAIKPGDVVTSMAGKTVEIINTDAEGRLVLADCMGYAKKLGATKIVDLATLTGACLVALGTTTTALITNNEEWMGQLVKAANEANEMVWQLPSYPEYGELIKSSIADLKNTGGRYAGTITAGLFIGEFAGETPWVHMDIAGTAWSAKEAGYSAKGGTGVAVRTLYYLARNLEN